MSNFHDILKIEAAGCPPDCSACEEVCRQDKDSGRHSGGRIKSIHLPEAGFHSALTCLQCGEPDCLEVCPTGAISRSGEDGVVHLDREKCTGCALCTLVCQYGGCYYQKETRQAVKCDLCDGKPRCVEACPTGILTFLRTGSLAGHLKSEDILPQGTAVCPGCGAELALRTTMKVLGKDLILFGAPGCAAMLVGACQVPTHMCLMTNVAATMTGVKRYYKLMGRDVRVVAFAGDGATGDVGFQSLSGAAERQENLIYICYDNEAYMNTGVQRSSTTPYHAWTFTTPAAGTRSGKQEPGKYLPLIMGFHGASYVATASISHPEDYVAKLRSAMAVTDGFVYLHILAPCPTGWRAPIDSTVETGRLAVETNYFPLWEADHGRFRITSEVKHPRPLREFTGLMGRFAHLKETDLAELQKSVDSRLRVIKSLASM